MKNWIDYILKSNKQDKGTPKMFNAPREPIGYFNNYYVKNDSLFAKVDLLDSNFYVRDKEDALTMLKDNVKRKEYDIDNAKKKLEEYQNKAKKIIELCGIIETDIDILQDEVDELNLLIAKNYPNES
jgi:peptidoglycan hydrolase CwlO-like protein